MGAKSSKPKSNKSKSSKTKSKSAPEPQTATATSSAPLRAEPSESVPTGPDTDSDELHPSWNDEILFQKDPQETKRVCKDDFDLLAVIGKGSFGKVMQVRKKDTGEIFAMKVLRKQAIIARKQVAHTRAEKSILQKLQHPFVVRLHYAFQNSEKLYMILDYVNGGELFFHLKKEGRFPEERVRFYAAEIISAIAHLHSLGIVYRDLKPENILLNMAGHIQLTDFGLSKEINEDGTSTFCGTPEYLAPEVLKGQSHGHAVDWWSLGTLLYEMLTGLPPFYSQNINSMYQKILTNELRFPSHISAEAKSLLSGLLTRDPDKRLGSGPDGGANIKAHPWFKKFDWARLDALGYEPPFKPKVTNAADTTQIDTLFTKEVAQDSQVTGSALSDAANRADDCFQGFTFVATGPLAGVVAPEN